MLSSLWWKVNPARYFTFRWRKVRARSKVSLRTVYACSVTSPLVTIIGNTPKIMWIHPKIYIGRFDWNTPVPGPASLALPKSFVSWNHEGGLLRIVSMLALVLQIVMCLEDRSCSSSISSCGPGFCGVAQSWGVTYLYPVSSADCMCMNRYSLHFLSSNVWGT